MWISSVLPVSSSWWINSWLFYQCWGVSVTHSVNVCTVWVCVRAVCNCQIWTWCYDLNMMVDITYDDRHHIRHQESSFNCLKWKLVARLCPMLCDPRDCSPPGSFVHRILQARILECVAMPSSRGSSQPRDRTRISCTVEDSLPSEPPGKP